MTRKKRKMTFDEILEKDWHISIIKLLWYYQDKEDMDGKTGLRQRHFRYALMERPKISEEKIDEIKDFFKKSHFSFESRQQPEDKNLPYLEFLWNYNIIKRGCADTRQKVSNHLSYLYDRGIIDKSGKWPDVRYKLNETYYELMNKKSIGGWVKKWHHDNILSDWRFYELVGNQEYYRKRTGLDGSTLQQKTTKSDFSGFSHLFNSSWFLCGFSHDIVNNLTQEEKDKLNQCMMTIEKNLTEIMELKFSKMGQNHKKWMNGIKKKRPDNHDGFINAVLNETIGFYYNGSKSLVSNERTKAVDEMFEKYMKKT